MARDLIRIGGGQAGYGDLIDPIVDQLEAGIDYLVCDGLAEATLAVLQKDRQRDESLGYTRDLPRYVEAALPWIGDGATTYITNAGGLSPMQAARVVSQTLSERGVTGKKIATVVGDDLRSHRASLDLPDDVVLVNAYLGARPIVDALERGADVVITGRVADASLFLAPLIFEFGWDPCNWDRMAAGVTVGHLLECSAQVSGNVFSGPWWDDEHPDRPGFPIAEVAADGSAIITKPPGTGGVVNFDTVREQLLYEVHDPARYLNPDVTADFTTLRLDDVGPDRVRVTGATGRPAPERYKALYARPAGWAGDTVMAFSWPDAEAKARAMAASLRARVESSGLVVDEWCEEYFGAGALHGDTARADLESARSHGWEPPEVVARVAWRCADLEAARAVGARRPGAIPAMMSPLGRPKRREPTQLLSLHDVLVDRDLVDAQVRVDVVDV